MLELLNNGDRMFFNNGNRKINFQRLGEDLNECVNDKLIIRVGRYDGNYYDEDKTFKRIKGEFFIKTNYDTIFRVVSDDSSIIDDFDIIDSNAIITPINKEIENSISYTVDVSNKESLRAYFPNDKVGIEMFECVQSLPVRFRQDAVDTFDSFFDSNGIVKETWNLKDVSKTWTYFLENIIQDMTDEEQRIYGF